MFYIKPQGGLGNRLRVIASAYKLCREINETATIVWDVNSALKCDYRKLFVLNTKIITIKNRTINTFNKYLYAAYDKFAYKEFGKTNNAIDVKYKMLTTCYNFYDAHDYYFLSPAVSVKNRVTELLKKYDGKRVVGVQIRRNDNKQSILVSPTCLFTNKIDEELRKVPNSVFYLATDDITTRKELIGKYGDRIIHNPTNQVRRDSEEGMFDAAVDLFALSKCQKIYGSYYSSFCEVASDIGGCELVVVK